ncbi:hypothetical protein GCM10018793_07670 [Streptomyces sulfonofaciens]|uniref:Uncharacterized protein n=1 Tax=Streptomyces sulfonofaciens TaxID=68272 RepID=A0A919FSX0_9ACTN|nr:hypothetical protein GCM10018793_07670 [Streptomyces sulfonofaciens]
MPGSRPGGPSRLGETTGLPVIEPDKHFRRPGLGAAPFDQWAAAQREPAGPKTWSMDGGLGPHDVPDVRLQAADTVILLDVPFRRRAWRAIRPSRERAEFRLRTWAWGRPGRPLLRTAITGRAGQADLHALRVPRARRRFVARVPVDRSPAGPLRRQPASGTGTATGSSGSVAVTARTIRRRSSGRCESHAPSL